MNSISQFRLARSYRVGIFSFIAAIGIAEALYFLLPNFVHSKIEIQSFPIEAESDKENNASNILTFEKFDPNLYRFEDWKKFNLSDKQIQTLLNYKNSLGGFRSKEEFRRCYSISDKLYAQLEPFIALPETAHSSYSQYNTASNSNHNSQNIRYQKFDPNSYSKADWKNIGFSEKQAQTILNYKNKFLKGHFTSVEELRNCYAISDQKYNEMKPYIHIKSITNKLEVESEDKPEIATSTLQAFRINDLDEAGWRNLGFTDKQISTILKYKKYCGGKFHSIEEFSKCYVVSHKKLQELKPFIIID